MVLMTYNIEITAYLTTVSADIILDLYFLCYVSVNVNNANVCFKCLHFLLIY